MFTQEFYFPLYEKKKKKEKKMWITYMVLIGYWGDR